jgi:hypothetical protein
MCIITAPLPPPRRSKNQPCSCKQRSTQREHEIATTRRRGDRKFSSSPGNYLATAFGLLSLYFLASSFALLSQSGWALYYFYVYFGIGARWMNVSKRNVVTKRSKENIKKSHHLCLKSVSDEWNGYTRVLYLLNATQWNVNGGK